MTKLEVMAARNKNGCCNRYADNQACDCLEKAAGKTPAGMRTKTRSELDGDLEAAAGGVNVRRRKLEEALQALWESSHQAEFDLCGEQREWHLPRLSKAARILMQLFPRETVEAVRRARDPYGDLISGEGE